MLAQAAAAAQAVEEVEEVEPSEEFDEEIEERTAVGTIPMGFRPPEPGESTVHERGRGRMPSASAAPASRRAQAPIERDTEPRARRPATPPSRRPLTEDDEASQSISLTQPTLNQRPRRGGDEDEEEGEEQVGEADESISVTPPSTGQRRRHVDSTSPSVVAAPSATGQRRRLAEESSQDDSLSQPTVNQRGGSRQRKALPVEEEDSQVEGDSDVSEELDEDAEPTEGIQEDPEDDESTAGFEQESEAPRRLSKGLLLALLGAAVVLMLLGGLYWALSSGPSESSGAGFGPQPAVPMTPPKAAAPTEQAAPPTPEPTPEAAANTGAANPEPSGTAAAAPADNPSGTETGSENTAVAANDDTAKPAGDAPQGEPGTEPAAPTEATPTAEPAKAESSGPRVEVVFRTKTASIRVDGQKVEPNKTLSYPPGRITVEWSCPPRRRREGSDIKRLKAGRKEPYVFDIKCRKSLR
jgi:serine/threonine-protein kinase